MKKVGSNEPYRNTIVARQYKPDLPDDVLKKKYRKRCKSLILGLHYGMADITLAHNLDLSLEDTRQLMNAYFTRYSSTAKWRQQCLEYAKKTGEIATLFGDKLRCDKKKWATQGFNYVLQNGASVAMQAKRKLACLNLVNCWELSERRQSASEPQK